ncbi:hypothetical protein HU200_055428 [Digitaria exilis]|uniref:Uncharacterized protein n=1 Tax=Digitaria exilis TaxID=1010633 RepID=A0A835ADF0_9POAL|nr:hypothetical protein HU200_055428 [Digitaria exilis]
MNPWTIDTGFGSMPDSSGRPKDKEK